MIDHNFQFKLNALFSQAKGMLGSTNVFKREDHILVMDAMESDFDAILDEMIKSDPEANFDKESFRYEFYDGSNELLVFPGEAIRNATVTYYFDKTIVALFPHSSRKVYMTDEALEAIKNGAGVQWYFESDSKENN